jgi:hypothetical protein
VKDTMQIQELAQLVEFKPLNVALSKLAAFAI